MSVKQLNNQDQFSQICLGTDKVHLAYGNVSEDFKGQYITHYIDTAFGITYVMLKHMFGTGVVCLTDRQDAKELAKAYNILYSAMSTQPFPFDLAVVDNCVLLQNVSGFHLLSALEILSDAIELKTFDSVSYVIPVFKGLPFVDKKKVLESITPVSAELTSAFVDVSPDTLYRLQYPDGVHTRFIYEADKSVHEIPFCVTAVTALDAEHALISYLDANNLSKIMIYDLKNSRPYGHLSSLVQSIDSNSIEFFSRDMDIYLKVNGLVLPPVCISQITKSFVCFTMYTATKTPLTLKLSAYPELLLTIMETGTEINIT